MISKCPGDLVCVSDYIQKAVMVGLPASEIELSVGPCPNRPESKNGRGKELVAHNGVD